MSPPKNAARGGGTPEQRGQTFLRKVQRMSFLITVPPSCNPDGELVLFNRRSSGHADELSPKLVAEMMADLGPVQPPTDAELDAMFEADMARRDAEAAATAREAEDIELSVSVAGKGKYRGEVRHAGKRFKFGPYKAERDVWLAIYAKADQIRATLNRNPAA